MRRYALVVSLGLVGCFNPDDAGAETDAAPSSDTETTASATETTAPTTSPASSSGPGSTGTTTPTTASGSDSSGETTAADASTTASTEATSDDGSSSTTDFVPGCDNGVVEDDELCFMEPVELDTLVSTQGVAIADLDGDDHLDVVVGDYGDGTTGGLYVYLGNGDGSFSDAIDSGESTPLIRVAAGAIADGVVDVIAMRATATSAIMRFRGNDDGSFSSITSYAGGSNWDVALADLNGDDRLDALGTNSGINVLIATASESFGAAETFGSPTSFQNVKTADIDGDGDVDVVAGVGAGIYAFINDGSGTLTAGTPFGQGSSDVMVGDFDGDGNVDVAGTGNSIVSVHFGDGDGGFSAGLELTVNASPIAGKTSDLDDDGFDDIVVVNTSGTTSILMSNGDGTFAPQELFTMLEGYLYDMDMGDLNEDGVDDVVVVSPNAGPVQLLLSHI
ncbi:MAG: FG-GAP repeat domain-containing protein [Nannocystaceae bacterium]|nr:VCBS repeat-containing protein [bacterium]